MRFRLKHITILFVLTFCFIFTAPMSIYAAEAETQTQDQIRETNPETDQTETDAAAAAAYEETQAQEITEDFTEESADEPTEEKATITLNKKSFYVNKGKKATLKASVKNAPGTKVVWSSGNKKVATVNSKGKITAKKKGTAVITATIEGTDISAKCTVHVAKIVTMRVKTTGYCPCKKCCGKNACGITASGTRAKQGRTIGVDRKLIKLGTKVQIGNKIYVAEDTGGVHGKIIDVFYSTHKKARAHGVKYKTVKIYM